MTKEQIIQLLNKAASGNEQAAEILHSEISNAGKKDGYGFGEMRWNFHNQINIIAASANGTKELVLTVKSPYVDVGVEHSIREEYTAPATAWVTNDKYAYRIRNFTRCLPNYWKDGIGTHWDVFYKTDDALYVERESMTGRTTHFAKVIGYIDPTDDEIQLVCRLWNKESVTNLGDAIIDETQALEPDDDAINAIKQMWNACKDALVMPFDDADLQQRHNDNRDGESTWTPEPIDIETLAQEIVDYFEMAEKAFQAWLHAPKRTESAEVSFDEYLASADDDDDYLSEETLAKLRKGGLDFGDE